MFLKLAEALKQAFLGEMDHRFCQDRRFLVILPFVLTLCCQSGRMVLRCGESEHYGWFVPKPGCLKHRSRLAGWCIAPWIQSGGVSKKVLQKFCPGMVKGFQANCMSNILQVLQTCCLKLIILAAQVDQVYRNTDLLVQLVTGCQKQQTCCVRSMQNHGTPRPLLRVASIFVFDMEGFGYNCMAQSNALRYGVLASFFWLVPFSFILLGATTNFIPCLKRRGLTWQKMKVINCMGHFLQVASTTMASVGLLPFMCYDHPNGNSEWSGLACCSYFQLTWIFLCDSQDCKVSWNFPTPYVDLLNTSPCRSSACPFGSWPLVSSPCVALLPGWLLHGPPAPNAAAWCPPSFFSFSDFVPANGGLASSSLHEALSKVVHSAATYLNLEVLKIYKLFAKKLGVAFAFAREYHCWR